jgi:hypothetical protein
MLSLAAIVWTGCGRLPTAPEAGSAGSSSAEDPQIVTTPGHSSAGFAAQSVAGETLQVLVQRWVRRGEATEVRGGRYRLRFQSRSLIDRDSALVTISQWSPNVVRVELGPHGIPFGAPVTFIVDYAGTNADPLSSNFDGSLPILLWLDPASNQWVQLLTINDVLRRTLTTQLSHFSTYAVGRKTSGTAEW